MRGVGARAVEDDMAAEPVPVCLPGAREIGTEDCEDASVRSAAEHTGRTNTGLNLKQVG